MSSKEGEKDRRQLSHFISLSNKTWTPTKQKLELKVMLLDLPIWRPLVEDHCVGTQVLVGGTAAYQLNEWHWLREEGKDKGSVDFC